MYYARLGQSLLWSTDPADFRHDAERIETLEVNLLRAGGVALNNLNRPHEALLEFEAALAAQGARRQPHEWMTHFGRDRMSALVRTTRFRLADIDGLYQSAVEQGAGGRPELFDFLLRLKRAECFLAFGSTSSIARAGTMLDELRDEAGRSTVLESLHRVTFARIYAQLSAARGDSLQYDQFRRQALDLARSAGLRHQLRTISAALSSPAGENVSRPNARSSVEAGQLHPSPFPRFWAMAPPPLRATGVRPVSPGLASPLAGGG